MPRADPAPGPADFGTADWWRRDVVRGELSTAFKKEAVSGTQEALEVKSAHQ